MEKIEQLYDAFGELVYVVAMADGVIQNEETQALEKILANHPWASEIKWSFNYEVTHNNSVDTLYKKVINICHNFGPRNEYQNLIEILEAVANASNGIDANERNVINQFTTDLIARFKNDLDKME